MNNQSLSWIKRSVDEQLARKQYPEGFPALPGVPTARYFDPDFAAAEMRHVWKKTWLLAGLESDLPQTGSYVLFEQLGLSVIVIRDKDGTTRAFHNTCSHRASALLLEPKGRATRFVCPYHAWTYGSDGSLLAVPAAHEFACLDKSEHGLKSVRCEMWRGLIFINLDPLAGSLVNYMAPVVAQTAGFPLENLVIQDHYFVEMACNWKLAYHNFIEAYHTNVVHPQTLTPYLDQNSFVVSLLDHGHARIAVKKTHGSSLYINEPTNADAADTIDPTYRQFGNVMSVFPSNYLALDPSGFGIQNFWPAGPGKSIMEVRLVGWEPKGTRPDYWSEMRGVLDLILVEDMRLFTSIQRGVESGVLPKLVMGHVERALYWFEEEIDRRIGADNIPAHMRVTQLLAGQVRREGDGVSCR